MNDLSRLVPSPFDAPLEPFPEGSRYRGLPLLIHRDAQGREIVYVARRWVPQPELFAEVGRYQVEAGDRIDNVSAAQLGDPQLHWRLADANRALSPAELTARVGRWLRLTLPPGFPGPGGT